MTNSANIYRKGEFFYESRASSSLEGAKVTIGYKSIKPNMEKSRNDCIKNKYNPNHLKPSESGHVRARVPRRDDPFPKNGEFIRNGKKYIRIVTRDYVRDLIVPEKDETPKGVILCESELDKLQNIKEEESKNKETEMKNKREQIENEAAESENRKRELEKHYVSYRKMGPTLSKLEYVAKLKANLLLQKANEVRQEDDDDIKLCNKLLLGTKCQAIRDAQIMERGQMKKELEEEEKRLNDLMEQERLKKLALEKEEDIFRLKKKNNYVKDLNDQVRRNLLEKEMEAEKAIEESMIISEAVMQTKIDTLREEEARRMKQQKIRREINQMNEQILGRLDEEREKAKLADLKIQELMKKKAEEEEEKEICLMKEKRERELELAKMRKAQQSHSDTIEKREAMRAHRVQQKYEEQWIQKERKEYEDKVKAIKDLKEGRRLQIEEKQKAQAKELERDLMQVARLQLMEETMQQKEKEQEEERRRAREEYKAQLLKQMNEKEKERILSRKSLFEDGIVLTMDMQLNQQSLKDNMRRKVEEIRTHKIPEKYIINVEKKLKSKTNCGYE